MVILASAIMLAVMLIISVIAYIKAPKEADLPMQWGLNGQVNWTMKPKYGVLIVPLLALICLCIPIAMDLALPEIPKGIHMFSALVIGLPLIVIHAGHMYFALKSVTKN